MRFQIVFQAIFVSLIFSFFLFLLPNFLHRLLAFSDFPPSTSSIVFSLHLYLFPTFLPPLLLSSSLCFFVIFQLSSLHFLYRLLSVSLSFSDSPPLVSSVIFSLYLYTTLLPSLHFLYCLLSLHLHLFPTLLSPFLLSSFSCIFVFSDSPPSASSIVDSR